MKKSSRVVDQLRLDSMFSFISCIKMDSQHRTIFSAYHQRDHTVWSEEGKKEAEIEFGLYSDSIPRGWDDIEESDELLSELEKALYQPKAITSYHNNKMYVETQSKMLSQVFGDTSTASDTAPINISSDKIPDKTNENNFQGEDSIHKELPTRLKKIFCQKSTSDINKLAEHLQTYSPTDVTKLAGEDHNNQDSQENGGIGKTTLQEKFQACVLDIHQKLEIKYMSAFNLTKTVAKEQKLWNEQGMVSLVKKQFKISKICP
jgi:hypothetical protein